MSALGKFEKMSGFHLSEVITRINILKGHDSSGRLPIFGRFRACYSRHLSSLTLAVHPRPPPRQIDHPVHLPHHVEQLLRPPVLALLE